MTTSLDITNILPEEIDGFIDRGINNNTSVICKINNIGAIDIKSLSSIKKKTTNKCQSHYIKESNIPFIGKKITLPDTSVIDGIESVFGIEIIFGITCSNKLSGYPKEHLTPLIYIKRSGDKDYTNLFNIWVRISQIHNNGEHISEGEILNIDIESNDDGIYPFDKSIPLNTLHEQNNDLLFLITITKFTSDLWLNMNNNDKSAYMFIQKYISASLLNENLIYSDYVNKHTLQPIPEISTKNIRNKIRR